MWHPFTLLVGLMAVCLVKEWAWRTHHHEPEWMGPATAVRSISLQFLPFHSPHGSDGSGWEERTDASGGDVRSEWGSFLPVPIILTRFSHPSLRYMSMIETFMNDLSEWRERTNVAWGTEAREVDDRRKDYVGGGVLCPSLLWHSYLHTYAINPTTHDGPTSLVSLTFLSFLMSIVWGECTVGEGHGTHRFARRMEGP